MSRILLAWLGLTDIRSAEGAESEGLGPIANATDALEFDRVVLLVDPKTGRRAQSYVKWARGRGAPPTTIHVTKLSGPTHFGEIYEEASKTIWEVLEKHGRDSELTFHLSPGTPAMAAVWIILAKTRFAATLIESSREHGVRVASVPFDISAEFLPDLLRRPDERLRRLSAGLPPDAPEFADIVHRSSVMKTVVARARRVAPRSVSVLIEGESGTGKELFARAIHRSSPRRAEAFVAVNCGAIPGELIESQLFGHKKGAFTGAIADRAGVFEQAHGGTLFLDEVSELPLSAQVKFLRVLQEGVVTPVGGAKEKKVDVRVVAATNRSLLKEVARAQFREDLFYRLAVAILRIPPLRTREGDLGVLMNYFLHQVNEESKTEPGFEPKKVSPTAKNLMLRHAWPGNVRELQSTIRRAAIWSSGPTIDADEIREALLPAKHSEEAVLGQTLGTGFDLREIMANVAQHYLSRALDESQGNKTQAASLLGLPSYQTLTNWLKRYGVEG